MRNLLWISLSILLSWNIAAGSIDFSGSVKPGFSLDHHQSADSVRILFQVPVRFMLHKSSSSLDFNAALVVAPSAGNPALENLGYTDEAGAFRISDPGSRILPGDWDGNESMSLVQNLDRFNLILRTSPATVTAGRQAIYWGVAKSVSPIDFIAPFQYGTFDTEYRPGVDAVRSVFPIGIMSELDAGYIFGRHAEFDRSALWLRGRVYLLHADVTLLAACFRENLMAGGSLNTSFEGGTVWIEAAIVNTGFFSNDSIDDDHFWTLSAGYDRSWFNAALYSYIEYHFNSPGSSSTCDYPYVMTGSAWTRGGIYLLGRHYLSPGIFWTPAPLWQIGSTALVNLTDGSINLTATCEYSAGQDFLIRCGLCSGFGEDSGGGNGVPGSEFGDLPAQYIVSAGYYF